jgi:hypothetical protein
MHGLDSGPPRARDAVLLVHEGGEQQSLRPTLEEQLGRHPA